MRVLKAILLIFIFALPFQAKLVIVTHYLLNQEVIADEFCINKEKVELECKGKCHLNKELKEVDSESESQNLPVLKLQNLEYFATETADLQKISATTSFYNVIFDDDDYKHQFDSCIFHPPKSLA